MYPASHPEQREHGQRRDREHHAEDDLRDPAVTDVQ